MDNVVYHTSGAMTPKQRLKRLINGLLAELQQQRPLLSAEERRMWLGLVLMSNRRQLINQATTHLEKR